MPISSQFSAPKSRYTLLETATNTASGRVVPGVNGGDYVWYCEGTWNGATATLQYLKLDGTTWANVKDSSNADVTLSADGSKSIGIAQGATLRVLITGTATSLNSVIAGI